ncbi:hypothetical protein [Pseudoalteromonas sp. T1lg10]|uniref:hypothetical protein n=1 Tax=Pseudoalteromonas sp. T1lg10 TaxID=2077093 RepID=UPI000CF64E38|nr:hypothetical protein [Pseudoalteromonas sp. T1lg10]
MIKPAKGTSQFKIGTPFGEVDFSGAEIYAVEERGELQVHKSKHIWFFFNSKTNELDQLSLFAPFTEKVLGKVGIGDSLSDVHEVLGKCCVNDKVHEPYNYPGVAFETKGGSSDGSAIVESISVSKPYPFYGDIPKHIASNMHGKKKRLP